MKDFQLKSRQLLSDVSAFIGGIFQIISFFHCKEFDETFVWLFGKNQNWVQLLEEI